MNNVSRNYQAANKARHESEAVYQTALEKQFGSKHWTAEKKDFNEETLAAFNAMHEAISAQYRARAVANNNSGDFGIYIGPGSPTQVYLEARKVCRVEADNFKLQLELQYGPYLPSQKAIELPFTEAIKTAFDAMNKALEDYKWVNDKGVVSGKT